MADKLEAVNEEHSILNSTDPVFIPYTEQIFASDQEFAKYLATIKPPKKDEPDEAPTPPSREKAPALDASENAPFMDALMANGARNVNQESLTAENKMLTINADVAFRSTNSPLVDVFFELTEGFDGKRINQALTDAWKEDPEATLKIIFNARSIHLGKASRPVAYNALGWLYQNHPQTLLANLIWLARPVIQKKVKKDEPEDVKPKNTSIKQGAGPDADMSDDFELVPDVNNNEKDTKDSDTDSAPFTIVEGDAVIGSNSAQHDVKNGVAHGYWKDLLNILALAVNDEFHIHADPRSVLNVDQRQATKPYKKNWSHEEAKKRRHDQKTERHSRAMAKFENDPAYQALHLTIARLFASQLRADAAALKTGQGRRRISLAAKWAPSLGEFHDKHTFVTSSIAEILHSRDIVCPGVSPANRELYLKHARQAYRSLTISPLRKYLAVVERDITASTFSNIKYERLPSLAMDRWQSTFLKKDEEHFGKFLDKVAKGDATISGAVLMPAKLVSRARPENSWLTVQPSKKSKSKGLEKFAEMRILDGQWNSIVQRIKDSGTLQSSIAVCDVSGSMTFPEFPDKTCPMDSAIGLSLLLAEVVEPPFGGAFITFSEEPHIQKVGGRSDKRTFAEKVQYIMQSSWGMNTDFVAVFEKLILPLAIEKGLKQEDMVKQVFVFSDMEFDAAQTGSTRWSTSFERIKQKYEEAGYEMPTLVFWNLAASKFHGEDPHPKPVTADEPGTALVSGYSQGQMKMFLDGGDFEDFEEEEVIKEEELKEGNGDDDDEDEVDAMVNVRVTKKQKVDPIAVVKRAISHPAYAMLKVVD